MVLDIEISGFIVPPLNMIEFHNPGGRELLLYQICKIKWYRLRLVLAAVFITLMTYSNRFFTTRSARARGFQHNSYSHLSSSFDTKPC